MAHNGQPTSPKPFEYWCKRCDVTGWTKMVPPLCWYCEQGDRLAPITDLASPTVYASVTREPTAEEHQRWLDAQRQFAMP